MNSKYYLLFNLEIRVSLIFYIISEKFFQLLFFENILINIPSLEVQKQTVDKFINLKIKFEQDIEEIENRIKLIDGHSKVYMDHIFKFY